MYSSLAMVGTVANALINNSCPAKYRALANGYSQVSANILRFFAPILMCNLFSYTSWRFISL